MGEIERIIGGWRRSVTIRRRNFIVKHGCCPEDVVKPMDVDTNRFGYVYNITTIEGQAMDIMLDAHLADHKIMKT